jgi:hypothetical protein
LLLAPHDRDEGEDHRQRDAREDQHLHQEKRMKRQPHGTYCTLAEDLCLAAAAEIEAARGVLTPIDPR